MNVALFSAGGLIFFALGLAHGLMTAREIGAAGSLSPESDELRDAMRSSRLRISRGANLWRCWLGFNLSHSIGLMGFGTTVVLLALVGGDLRAEFPVMELAPLAVASAYCLLALAFWFWAPALAAGLASVLLAGAAFL